MTINFTLYIDNCLYFEDFLKSAEHNRKIHLNALTIPRPRISTKLSKLQLKVIVNITKKFGDESGIFLEVISEKSAKFHLKIFFKVKFHSYGRKSRGDKKNP